MTHSLMTPSVAETSFTCRFSFLKSLCINIKKNQSKVVLYPATFLLSYSEKRGHTGLKHTIINNSVHTCPLLERPLVSPKLHTPWLILIYEG